MSAGMQATDVGNHEGPTLRRPGLDVGEALFNYGEMNLNPANMGIDQHMVVDYLIA